MPPRQTPYGAFNFIINMNGDEDQPLGGFSDVSGINWELTVAEYRNGNDRENHVRKVPGMHKVGDVTLKRGVINSARWWDWMKRVQRTGYAEKKDTVSITLLSEEGSPVQTWTLQGVAPLKYSGPTLAAKGGTDVAMEELVLSVEGIDLTEGA